MKRTILALAIAGLSLSAYALPPPGAGTPLNVNVTNPSIDVNVTGQPSPYTELSTMPDMNYAGGIGTPAETNADYEYSLYGTADAVWILRGISADVDATASTKDAERRCFISISAKDEQGFTKSIFRMMVQAGARDGRYQPVHNLRLPGGYKLSTKVRNETDNYCNTAVSYDLVKLQ